MLPIYKKSTYIGMQLTIATCLALLLVSGCGRLSTGAPGSGVAASERADVKPDKAVASQKTQDKSQDKVAYSAVIEPPRSAEPSQASAAGADRSAAVGKSAARRPRVALVLGGGAARGFAHIGVIKVLEANGIVPDIVVGTSAGSIVGAIYAAGLSPADIQRQAMALDEVGLNDWSLSSRGMVRGEALQTLVNRLVAQRPIEKLPKKFAATAVDVQSGRLVVFERGNTGLAVRASSSVPGIVQPTTIAGVDYVDGGVVSPVPVAVARRLGADVVIAVDISAKPQSMKQPSALDVALQSLTIMCEALAGFEVAEADVLIRPKVGNISSTAFQARHHLILEGEQAAQRVLPQIRDRLQR